MTLYELYKETAVCITASVRIEQCHLKTDVLHILQLHIGETGRRQGERFREHLHDIEKHDKNGSQPVARHFNLPSHSKQHIAVCGLSLHQGNTEAAKL